MARQAYWGRQPGRSRGPFGSLVEYPVLVVLVAVFIWRAFVPAWRSLNTDFPNYYLAARLYRQGYPLDRVYDWVWFQRQKDHAGLTQSLVSFIPLTPFSLLPVLPLSSLPALEAKHFWLVANLLFLSLAVYLLRRMTGLGVRRILIITFLALVPLRTNFLFGQEHVLVFLLLTLAAWLYLDGRQSTSGAVLALASALKVYPALFLIYFLRKRQWRAAAGLSLGSLILGVLSLQLFGLETLRVYFIQVLPRPLRGEALDPYNVEYNSLTALLHRLLIAEPELNPHPFVHLPAAYAFLQPLCQALLFVPFVWLMYSSRAEPAREKLEWGSYVALLLILSTNPAPYHFCALILCAALAAGYLKDAHQGRKTRELLILYGLVCFPLYHWAPKSPVGWKALLAFPRLYALFALWIFLLRTLASSAPLNSTARVKSREAAVFGCIFLALVVGGTWSNLRQLKGQFANYGSRLMVVPGSLMAVEPAPADDRVLFTRLSLSLGRYITGNLVGGSLTFFPFGVDAFHPTQDSGSAEGWVELASTKSQIVRFPLRGLLLASVPLHVAADDAEQPVVSADGEWLAFIRETQGRGSLWVKGLRSSAANPLPNNTEWKVVDHTYDVRDVAFFPDRRIAFAAQPGNRPELFVADAVSRHVAPLVASKQPIRYPAVSPDGQWLAYSQEDRGAWQLWVKKLATGEERRLTSANCNSISPAWLSNSKTLVYATDCGRGLGLTALCQIRLVP